jgi:hypothetical protein
MRLFGNAIQNYYGSLNVSAAPSTTAITTNGASGYNSAIFQTTGLGAGTSYGVFIVAGTNSTDAPLRVLNQAQSATFLAVYGDGHGTMGPSSTLGMSWSATGNLSSVASATGNAYGSYAVNIQAPVTGNSFGLFIQAGVAASDYSFAVNNAAGSTNMFAVRGDGGVTIGAPTGGDQGAGTINVAGNVYVNGVAVGGSGVTTGTFTGTLTGMTTSPSVTCYWTKVGTSVTLRMQSTVATSNSNNMTMTGLPSAIQTASSSGQFTMYAIEDNGTTYQLGSVNVSGAVVYFAKGQAATGAGTFTASGIKGFSDDISITYDTH